MLWSAAGVLQKRRRGGSDFRRRSERSASGQPGGFAEPAASCPGRGAKGREERGGEGEPETPRRGARRPPGRAGSWKTVCVKELNGLRKLKRKGKEPARRANGYKTFRLDLEAPERGAAAAAAAANGLRDGPPPPPPGQGAGGPEAQPFREPGLRPRILLCAPPARPTPSAPPAPPAPPEASVRAAPPTRPGESSYSSISHVIYNNHPDSSASPRKRPGEATPAASEIKALQQTRRLLANARERTRVHTISAAFEALRKQVPCYSYGQKLSKLAILRIACNYILSLARLADLDYSADHSNLSFSECVQRCTRTLQAEGRAKKRKAVLGSEATSANKTDRVDTSDPKGTREAILSVMFKVYFCRRTCLKGVFYDSVTESRFLIPAGPAVHRIVGSEDVSPDSALRDAPASCVPFSLLSLS
nr:protein atonal homolog 8 [Vulpes vulpes]